MPYRKRTPGDGCPYRARRSVSQAPLRRRHPEGRRGIFAPNICMAAAEMRRSFDALRLLRTTRFWEMLRYRKNCQLSTVNCQLSIVHSAFCIRCGPPEAIGLCEGNGKWTDVNYVGLFCDKSATFLTQGWDIFGTLFCRIHVIIIVSKK